ncbi:hypothetical protein QRD40_10615 [Comamonas sp. Y6]|uniref:Uncharacterized protein n=1 Tax=Comamonas resistens TaxID=3046670 RepID=A0ABY8SVQ9_9BURK|nr:hypothetical protein [Comamonas resistens]MDL5036798.1 hypothetical protein [Comamonas resistens]WHS67108.1 hypothetical protein QMY55_08330 [Comamonas resistens]
MTQQAPQTTSEYQSTLASKCQGVARNLSYNDPVVGSAKQTLIEASHALDSSAVRVHKKRDGLLLINARGKSRYMTWRERIAYLLLGTTEIRP